MVKSCLTVRVERHVTDESDWQQLGGLASSILHTVSEKRAKLEVLKASVARDQASALQPACGGISVQLGLPLVSVPASPASQDERRAQSPEAMRPIA